MSMIVSARLVRGSTPCSTAMYRKARDLCSTREPDTLAAEQLYGTVRWVGASGSVSIHPHSAPAVS